MPTYIQHGQKGKNIMRRKIKRLVRKIDRVMGKNMATWLAWQVVQAGIIAGIAWLLAEWMCKVAAKIIFKG